MTVLSHSLVITENYNIYFTLYLPSPILTFPNHRGVKLRVVDVVVVEVENLQGI